MKLTGDELKELTERINARLLEFGDKVFDPVAPGVVRLIHSVLGEWEADRAVACEPDPAPVAPVLFVPPPPRGAVTIESNANTITVPNGNGHALSAQAAATLGREHTLVTPLKATARVAPNGNHLPTVDEVVAQVRRIAMGGVMPTMAAFDASRPADWSTAQAHLLRLNLSWESLREIAELKPNPRNKSASD